MSSTKCGNLLSFGHTEFVNDLKWVATLSDGREVHQDDGRYDADTFSAWIRLKEFVIDNEIDIVGLRIEFRSHIEAIPSNQRGYFFSLGASKDFYSEETWHNYVVGWIDENNMLNKWTFKVPELTCITKQTLECPQNDIRLVLNGKSTN